MIPDSLDRALHIRYGETRCEDLYKLAATLVGHQLFDTPVAAIAAIEEQMGLIVTKAEVPTIRNTLDGTDVPLDEVLTTQIRDLAYESRGEEYVGIRGDGEFISSGKKIGLAPALDREAMEKADREWMATHDDDFFLDLGGPTRAE